MTAPELSGAALHWCASCGQPRPQFGATDNASCPEPRIVKSFRASSANAFYRIEITAQPRRIR